MFQVKKFGMTMPRDLFRHRFEEREGLGFSVASGKYTKSERVCVVVSRTEPLCPLYPDALMPSDEVIAIGSWRVMSLKETRERLRKRPITITFAKGPRRDLAFIEQEERRDMAAHDYNAIITSNYDELKAKNAKLRREIDISKDQLRTARDTASPLRQDAALKEESEFTKIKERAYAAAQEHLRGEDSDDDLDVRKISVALIIDELSEAITTARKNERASRQEAFAAHKEKELAQKAPNSLRALSIARAEVLRTGALLMTILREIDGSYSEEVYSEEEEEDPSSFFLLAEPERRAKTARLSERILAVLREKDKDNATTLHHLKDQIQRLCTANDTANDALKVLSEIHSSTVDELLNHTNGQQPLETNPQHHALLATARAFDSDQNKAPPPPLFLNQSPSSATSTSNSNKGVSFASSLSPEHSTHSAAYYSPFP